MNVTPLDSDSWPDAVLDNVHSASIEACPPRRVMKPYRRSKNKELTICIRVGEDVLRGGMVGDDDLMRYNRVSSRLK
jgi:hypothetical protein